MRIEPAYHFLPHACSVFHLIRAQQEYRMLRSMCDENVKPWIIHRLGGPLLKFDGERVIFSSLPLSDCCVARLEHSKVSNGTGSVLKGAPRAQGAPPAPQHP